MGMSALQQAHTAKLDAVKLAQALVQVDGLLTELVKDVAVALQTHRIDKIQARYLTNGLELARDLIPKGVFQ